MINNADGDAQKQRSQADQCLANGAKVVILVSLDAGSSLAIEKAAGREEREGDRVRPPGRQGLARLDLHLVRRPRGRRAAGQGRRRGPEGERQVRAEAGRRGAERRPDGQQLVPVQGRVRLASSTRCIKNGTFTKGPDQFVPGWDNQKARTIFEQMLVQTGNKIDAVAAANDGLANAVVTALKAKKLKPIPLSGQDATAQGVQNIISGWQSMTVWKEYAEARHGVGRGGGRPLEGPEAEARPGRCRTAQEAAGVHHPAGVDHEGELQAALQDGYLKRSRRLPRRVQAVLQVAGSSEGAPRAGAPSTLPTMTATCRDRHRRPTASATPTLEARGDPQELRLGRRA